MEKKNSVNNENRNGLFVIAKNNRNLSKDIFTSEHYWSNNGDDSLIFNTMDNANIYHSRLFQNLITVEESKNINIRISEVNKPSYRNKMSNGKQVKIGIDIGGVIIAKYNMGQDTSFFSENYLHSKAVSGAFETIKYLTNIFGPENIYLISKCGNKLKEKTLEWFDYNNFYKITGFLERNIYFCYDRDSKIQICENLKITHFIDDRDDILWRMMGIVDYLLYFKPFYTMNYQGFDEPFKKMMGWRSVYNYFKNITIT